MSIPLFKGRKVSCGESGVFLDDGQRPFPACFNGKPLGPIVVLR